MKKAFLNLHIAVFLAGFTGILGRLITLNESLLVWYRLLISSVTMWIIYLAFKRLQKISLADLLKITCVGFIAALHWVCFYGAIKYANISVSLVCFSAIGFFTALLEPMITRQKLNKVELALGLMVIAGIYIIFRFDAQYKTGIIFGMVAALLGALFPIFNRLLLRRINVETLTTYEFSGGLLTLSLLLPFYLHHFPATALWPDWKDLGWLFILSWICTVWAFQLSARALKKISAFTVNLTYNLEPVYGILLAFIIYKENKFLSQWFYVGFALIAAALVVHILMLFREERKLSANRFEEI
jgi:drug/metabolite transporter (DMT)-like permease